MPAPAPARKYTNASFDHFGRYETDTFVLSHKNQKKDEEGCSNEG